MKAYWMFWWASIFMITAGSVLLMLGVVRDFGPDEVIDMVAHFGVGVLLVFGGAGTWLYYLYCRRVGDYWEEHIIRPDQAFFWPNGTGVFPCVCTRCNRELGYTEREFEIRQNGDCYGIVACRTCRAKQIWKEAKKNG